MGNPLVSVVMSVYNGERHLSASIESILSQTLCNLELILINDGSTDRSPEIIEGFARSDARVRVINQSNTGLTKALIRGCQVARGRYIARQDADDWSHPQRLEKQMALLERRPDVVMASCWADYIDDSGDVLQQIRRPTDPQKATRGLLYDRQGPPAHGTMIFRRDDYEAVGGYRAAFYYSQDSDLWLRLAGRGAVAYVPEVLYRARISAAGISSVSSVWQHQFGELGQLASAARLQGQSDDPFVQQAEELCRRIVEARQDEQVVRRQQSAAYYRMGTMLSRQGNSRSREYFWSAIRFNPWHWRSWCRLGVELVRHGLPVDGAKKK